MVRLIVGVEVVVALVSGGLNVLGRKFGGRSGLNKVSQHRGVTNLDGLKVWKIERGA